MRKSVLFFFSGLLSLCAAAHAEWKPVARDKDAAAQRFVLYVDFGSIQRKEERVTVRVLLNMREKTDDGIASVIATDEYDCVRDRMRSRAVTSYAELNGKGRVIRDFKNLGAWVPVEPGKINEAVLENVCDFYPNWWSE